MSGEANLNIIQALDHSKLFGPYFQDQSWFAWRVILKAAFAVEMDEEEYEKYKELSGREEVLDEPAEELWVVSGIRAGKSRMISLIATYLAAFRDFSPYLSIGETPRVVIMAASQYQARIVFNYIESYFVNIPALYNLVAPKGFYKEAIELESGLVVEVHTNNYKIIQGYTAPIVICDEIAYWEDEDSRSPDKEVVDAARGRMATFPRGYRMLLGISSPNRQTGVLWNQYEQHWGQDGDPILCFHGSTRDLNPTISESYIQQKFKEDPYMASRYFEAEFRSDIQGFLDEDWIDAAVNLDRPEELEPSPEKKYLAFCDPSGGRGDAMTLTIVHQEDGVVVTDTCRGRTGTFNPRDVVAEFAEVLKRYGLRKVVGDRYSGNWASDAFQEYGIKYEPAERAKGEIYMEAGPLFAQGAVEIPDKKVLLQELRQLERRKNRNGKETIDHPKRKNDDFANSLCGALLLAYEGRNRNVDFSQASFGPAMETATLH